MRGVRLFLLGGVSLAALLLAPFIGMQEVSLADLVRGQLPETAATIFWQIRLPRVLLAWLAGSTLALCGMIFQALCRNPLASPDILGVTSGASFGAVLSIRLASLWGLGMLLSLPLGAFLGASAAIALLLLCVSLGRGLRDSTLLLAGVAINFLFSSMTMIVQYVGDQFESFRFMRWTLGGLQVVGYSGIGMAFPVWVLLAASALCHVFELDLFVCGDELALSRGIEVRKIRGRLFALISLSVASVVALCGPIGFVGLMVPHICRLIVGGSHRFLAPAVCLAGGLMLVFCDTLARTLWAPVEMPVGILTSCCGAPFFLWLLLKKERDRVTDAGL